MHIYFCWITALLPNYQDGVIAGLVKRGYMVGPAAKDGGITITHGACPAALISLSVYKAEEITASDIYTDIAAIFAELKYYYYSIVVSLSQDATWNGPNFDHMTLKSDKETATPPPLPPGPKKNMN